MVGGRAGGDILTDRLTAAGDSVLAAGADLPIALYVLDGGGTAYPVGAPAVGGGSGSATGTHAVELVSDGRCEGQRLLLHPMPARAEVGDGFSPVLLVEGWAPPDETSVAVGAAAFPRPCPAATVPTMTHRSMADMERELREAGHQVERTYEAPVRSRQTAADAEWVFRVDGKVVARGSAMRALEEALARWISERER